MRILSIGGENLASLAAPFSIDLDADPIGGTGIFAITGETGAGKSTILDALCLALYGQYPRVSSGRREDVPDPSGQPLGSGDPRAILRRGAASGFAQVDFVGRDGIAYRARWEAYRARGRANGRLQNETRTLSRIEDGAPVATGKTLVNEAVVSRTDLTFEQFRRTVVLAQGEFDAFLLASETDRADLLEKITGTGVYTEISKRVHAGTDARRAAFAVLVARQEAIGMLDEEARGAKLAELAAIEGGMSTLLAEQAVLVEGLAHSRRLLEAGIRLEAATRHAAEAAEALGAGAGDAARVVEIEAVQPLRPIADAVASAVRTLAGTDEVRNRARGEVEVSGARLAELQAGQALARTAEEAAENDLKAFTPLWSAADILDARILELSDEARVAAATATEAAAALDAAGTSRQTLERSHRDAVSSRDAAAARIATDAAMVLLADRAADAAGLFEKRTALMAERETTCDALKDAQARIGASDLATAAARDRMAAAQEARGLHLAERAAHEGERQALDVEAAEAGHAQLGILLDRLAVGADLARRQDRAAAELGRADAALSEAGSSMERAGARRAEAEARHGQAARARNEIAAVAELAELGASAEAARLRSFLVPGGPCPVCGSSDHPGGEGGHGTDGMSRMAETMRGRRAEIDAELARAASDVASAIAAGADATARFEAAGREAALARAALSDGAEAYAGLAPGLDAARASAGFIDAVPASLDAGAARSIGDLAAKARTTREALAATLERARVLSRRIRDREASIALADGEIATSERIVSAEAGPRQLAILAGERERTRVGALTERVESLVRELGPFLAAAGLDEAALTHDAIGTARRIAAFGEAFHDLRQRHRDLEAACQAVVPRLAVAIEAEATAAVVSKTAATAARDRAAMEAKARLARSELLGGEATAPHRDRITAIRDAARADLAMAHEAVGIGSALHATARGASTHAEAQRQKAVDALAAARMRFREACGSLAEEAVFALLEIPDETLASLRDRRDRLLRAHEAAQAALATRHADLEGLRALPAVDVPATEAAATQVAETIAALQRRRGALDADIARDDEARGRAADLSHGIEAARETLTDWEAVDVAIGSANGDRFRRFAQGVTLEHLARLANEQLSILSPRYALVRSRGADLTLHVLDRDMGDELRGTRSLSGGERFLVALALALALSGMEGRAAFVDTLFIDEGFGSLDAETLDVAIDALETLHGQGRRVGVITHVAAMMDRIAIQVRVERRGNGRSVVRVADGTHAA